jgi:Di-haem oxidoreductase, putative peroxidase
MSNEPYHPFSDFALHHMGSTLADGITQGSARPDEFRTAPLWGVGQRLFFLHDGRASDLLAAIEAHMSSGNNCAGSPTPTVSTSSGAGCASEANAVITKFNALTASQQQDILNFLRSL